MPKKKKNGHSPNRVSAQTGEHRSAQRANGGSSAWVDPRGRGNRGPVLATSSTASLTGKDDIVKCMQEMFSHLDPVVIYIVLSEADFKVENAMDALLELSDAAEGKTKPPSPLSGFELAAALLDPRTPKTEPAMVTSESSSASEAACLTEELDSLIDQELENLTSLQSQPSDRPSSLSVPLSSLSLPSQSVFPSTLPTQNILTGHPTSSVFEHLDMDNQNGASGGPSPIKELSFCAASLPQESDVSVDFSHLTEDPESDGLRPSAFKAYRRPDQFMNTTEITSAVPRSEGLHTPATIWNIQAPEFQPQAEEPTFITPVMKASNPWSTFSAAQWLAPRPFSQAPLKPSATVPKSWTLPLQSPLRLDGQVLVLLRGAPGSGKTTLASAMLEQNLGGVVLSTDEYFIQNGVYHYNPDLLGEAHAWNHRRAREALENGYTPIIIDNTNLQCWEMKPYVAMALKHKYKVMFREPDTWWKTKPKELEKRSKHGVTKEKIRRMLEHQDRHVSVHNIMSSQPKVTAVCSGDVPQTDPAQKLLLAGLCRPDLVGDPGFVEPAAHLSSSLPDVSSVGEFSPEDCSVLMDLNFAKLLHQKWKETIQEQHRQAALSYLLQESSVPWGEPQTSTVGQRDPAARFLIGQSGVQECFPFMDHWNVSQPRVSLRDIMIEEQVMQDSLQRSRLGLQDLDKKDGATILKENQLFDMFPTIDRHFLRDIFTDHNYSLEQTEQFLHALLDDGPVRNVVAPKISPDRNEAQRAPRKERKWKQKDWEQEVVVFQDTEDPEYEDFRTEAMLQWHRQQECFSKAAEAHKQGRKDVASFYAKQGRLHGQKMREAHHRAAVQIFERVNATLLPQNVLDLHGLHVDEALQHLQQVLTDKTSEWQQGLCRPQLSVITGRGNRSQGGVARIRPAVLDYLQSQHYRYSEPKVGLILVTLH
ncbi:NEDD4-binding protein 2 isoform X2 [Brachyhypopomus gauderio]|uniref:NEDD4-binding protein 2 isoform X2 n=1 Tax=Brachyhypopomus gauderio TaxID=698409 RepID=UPI0040425F80